MKILLFSDVHRDLDACERLVGLAADANLVLGAGDFASVHRGLQETIAALSHIDKPALLVPGNNERTVALRDACAHWPTAHVLHGDRTEIGGVSFFGLGAGVPVTPFGDWSFDLTEDEARALLTDCPEGAVLISHSPPKGHCDRTSAGDHAGSEAVLETIKAKRPRLVVCGHIHDSWGEESRVGETLIINVGPRGRVVEV